MAQRNGGLVDTTVEQLDVVDAIFTTRSMRRLRPDPVDEQAVWEILDAAIRGPSGGNAQRWGWVVVTDRAVKDQIGRWYLEAWDALGAGRRVRLGRALGHLVGRTSPAAGADGGDVNLRSGAYLAQHIASAPVWIFAVQRGIRRSPTLIDGADIFGAIQNLMLAARKLGLGSTLTMLHRRNERDVARLLGLPRDARTIALIPLGYPVTAFSTPVRRAVDTVTHWERWGRMRSAPPRSATVR